MDEEDPVHAFEEVTDRVDDVAPAGCSEFAEEPRRVTDWKKCASHRPIGADFFAANISAEVDALHCPPF